MPISFLHISIPDTKIMDLYRLFYKCFNAACQKWRPNIPNHRYSIKPLLLQYQLKSIETNIEKKKKFKHFEMTDHYRKK